MTVITKVATAPFRALGALFGGGGEKLEAIAFEPGRDVVLPPEREKLKRVGEVLSKRPRLKLTVHGGYDAKLDGEALRAFRVRQDLAQRLGVKLKPGEDSRPGRARRREDAARARGAADRARRRQGRRRARGAVRKEQRQESRSRQPGVGTRGPRRWRPWALRGALSTARRDGVAGRVGADGACTAPRRSRRPRAQRGRRRGGGARRGG